MFLLVFDFTNFIQLLIAIPSMGVLSILTGFIIGLVLYVTDWMYTNDGKFVVVFVLCMALFLLGLAIASVRMRFFNKKFAGVMLNIGYALTPFCIAFFPVVMSECTKYYVDDNCGSHLTYTFWKDISESPAIVLPFVFAGICWYFTLVKRWYAKEE